MLSYHPHPSLLAIFLSLLHPKPWRASQAFRLGRKQLQATAWMILQCITYCILSGLPVHSAEAILKLLYYGINPVMSDWYSSGHTHV